MLFINLLEVPLKAAEEHANYMRTVAVTKIHNLSDVSQNRRFIHQTLGENSHFWLIFD